MNYKHIFNEKIYLKINLKLELELITKTYTSLFSNTVVKLARASISIYV